MFHPPVHLSAHTSDASAATAHIPTSCGVMWLASPHSCRPFSHLQGLASGAIYDHYLQSRDQTWLNTAFPALNGTAWATEAARASCNAACAGLMPVGGGDGGLPNGHVYVQETGALFGIKAAASAAKVLGLTSDAAALEAVFSEFQSALQSSMAAQRIAVGGFDVIPMYPAQSVTGYDQSNWGAVDLISPFPLVPGNGSLYGRHRHS